MLREATNSIVENDDMPETLLTLDRGAITRAEVMGEICHHLAPFQIGEKPITGASKTLCGWRRRVRRSGASQRRR